MLKQFSEQELLGKPLSEDQKKELLALMGARIQQLPAMQKQVLALYYFENMRLAEIAQVFGVTESRVCQIHTQAVVGLRTYLKAAQER